MDIDNRAYIAAAREMYHDGGNLEIPDDPSVSRVHGRSDGGAYVQAWVWIRDEDAITTIQELIDADYKERTPGNRNRGL